MKSKILYLALITFFGISGCADPAAELAQQNKEIISKAFEVVGAGDYDYMDNYISSNYVRHSQATPDLNIRSLSEFKEFIRQDRLVIPDQQLEVKKLIVEGDLVAFWATYKGTQTGQMGPFPPSNKYVELDFSGYHRLENGKIAETWVIWDNISFLTQLGHFPPPPDQPEDE